MNQTNGVTLATTSLACGYNDKFYNYGLIHGIFKPNDTAQMIG